MKTYKATILHNGKFNNQIVKDDLTAAQIVMLKKEHGDHAVIDIFETGIAKNADGSKVTAIQEKNRLIKIYSKKNFEVMFPGFAPALPTDLAELGIDHTTLDGEKQLLSTEEDDGETVAKAPVAAVVAGAEKAKELATAENG